MKVPIISTDVGIARDFLHPDTISPTMDLNDVVIPTAEHIEFAFNNAENCTLKKHIPEYDKFFIEHYEKYKATK